MQLKRWVLWTDEEHQLLINLSEQGCGPTVIAARLGRTVGVVSKKRAELGMVRRHAVCLTCSGAIEGHKPGRPRQYCSRECQYAMAVLRRQEVLARQAAARLDWSCAVCGQEMPHDRVSRLYCSNSCNKKAWYLRHKARKKERAATAMVAAQVRVAKAVSKTETHSET